jgi:hypothetical protein
VGSERKREKAEKLLPGYGEGLDYLLGIAKQMWAESPCSSRVGRDVAGDHPGWARMLVRKEAEWEGGIRIGGGAAAVECTTAAWMSAPFSKRCLAAARWFLLNASMSGVQPCAVMSGVWFVARGGADEGGAGGGRRSA